MLDSQAWRHFFQPSYRASLLAFRAISYLPVQAPTCMATRMRKTAYNIGHTQANGLEAGREAGMLKEQHP